jgi:hypothetical protein
MAGNVNLLLGEGIDARVEHASGDITGHLHRGQSTRFVRNHVAFKTTARPS